jgi:hypothetical protein
MNFLGSVITFATRLIAENRCAVFAFHRGTYGRETVPTPTMDRPPVSRVKRSDLRIAPHSRETVPRPHDGQFYRSGGNGAIVNLLAVLMCLCPRLAA